MAGKLFEIGLKTKTPRFIKKDDQLRIPLIPEDCNVEVSIPSAFESKEENRRSWKKLPLIFRFFLVFYLGPLTHYHLGNSFQRFEQIGSLWYKDFFFGGQKCTIFQGSKS